MEDRTIIQPIQILLSIYADYCFLICTFLLSLKCYDTLKYKNKYFPNGKKIKKKLIIFTVLISISAGVIFLIIDLFTNHKNDIYTTKHSCNDWNWLRHVTSEICCCCFYWILLIGNIVLFVKIIKFLNLKKKELYEEDEQIEPNVKNVGSEDNKEKENEDNNEEDNKKLNPHKVKKANINLARINGLKLIKIKCTIYPVVSVIIWVIATTYILLDVILLNSNNNGGLTEEILLIIYTFFASTRGLFYGISLILLEEKIFWNFFRRKSDIYKKPERKKNDDEDECNDEEFDGEEKLNDDYEEVDYFWRICESGGDLNCSEMGISSNEGLGI